MHVDLKRVKTRKLLPHGKYKNKHSYFITELLILSISKINIGEFHQRNKLIFAEVFKIALLFLFSAACRQLH